MNVPKEIQIKPCLNGFIVKVGCQCVVHNSIDDLISDLDRYLRSPKAFESEFIRQKSMYPDFARETLIPQNRLCDLPTPTSGMDRAQCTQSEAPAPPSCEPR